MSNETKLSNVVQFRSDSVTVNAMSIVKQHAASRSIRLGKKRRQKLDIQTCTYKLVVIGLYKQDGEAHGEVEGESCDCMCISRLFFFCKEGWNPLSHPLSLFITPPPWPSFASPSILTIHVYSVLV